MNQSPSASASGNRNPVDAPVPAHRRSGRPSTPLRRVGPFLLPLLLGVAALSLVCGRFMWQARRSVDAAQLALHAGDQAEATRFYLDALRAYVPGSPDQRRALDGLQALAVTARAAGDPVSERRAWEAMRAGLLGTRSLYLPSPELFAEANRRLAELDGAAAFPPRGPVVPDPGTVSRRGNGPGRSVRPPGPAVASTLVSLMGFALWVGAVVLMIRRGVDRAARPGGVGRLMLPVMFLLGVALFLAGLRFS